jgi:methylmalonyl-CoA/ethylmalonyl-CoA epimerase
MTFAWGLSTLPLLGLPHHQAYLVADLERAAAGWHDLTGIGPFIVLPHVQFDELTVYGTPSTLDHTAAFAAFGEQFIELQVIHDISPWARVPFGADAATPALHNMAFAVSDFDEASAQLTSAGVERVVTASGSGLCVVLHDARHITGARIAVHQNNDFFRALFGEVRSAAKRWDRRELLPFGG